MSSAVRVRSSTEERSVTGPRIVFLTNIIPPYQKPVLDQLSKRYARMRILLSTPMEGNRSWKLDWKGLDVVVQRTLTLKGLWRHPKGFNERLYLHLPIDTVWQLKRFDADVVISWEMGTRTILAALYRWIWRRTRLIVWAEFSEATEYGRGPLRQMLRKLLHHAIDGFLVTGESGARYLRHLGIPQRKIHKLAYTTDVSSFARVPITRPTQHAWRLLYVGQLIPRKGLLQFVEALARWANFHKERTVEFFLAGEGPLGSSLEQYACPSNLSAKLLGNIAYDHLPEVYGQAGIFVFPTFADTWGVVVNEAMAAGVPVLGSAYGQAVSELIEDDISGWTFRPDVSDEMFQAIDKCLTTSIGKLSEMRANARRAALRLTPDHVATVIETAITSIAGPLGSA